MQIAILIPSFALGGAESVLVRLAGRFANAGHQVQLITSCAGGQLESAIAANVSWKNLGYRKSSHAIIGLTRHLFRTKPDVLLSSTLSANFLAVAAARITRTPCVLREANNVSKDTISTTSIKTAINRLSVKLLYPKANAIIALTDGLAEILASFAPALRERISIIPNPTPETSRNDTEVKDRKGILACGRLVPQKDFGALLEAFSRAALEDTARLTIVGDGPQEVTLKSFCKANGIAHRVDFLPATTDIAEIMSQSDVFALTSRFEGFPNVLLEALSMGCKVVSTLSSDAVRIVLRDGEFGEIVPVGDVTALSRAFERQSGISPPDPITLKEHLRAFDIERISRMYLKVLSEASGVN